MHRSIRLGIAAVFLSSLSVWAIAQEAKPKSDAPQAKPAQDKPAAGQKADDKAGKPEEKVKLPVCPMMAKPIDFNIKTMTDDGPVYFCCTMCIEMYKADPAKYKDKVAEQRAALAKLPKVQVTCPLTGKEVKKDSPSVEQDGQKIYFCCPNCPEKFKKEPAAYKAKLLGCYSYQTKCPVGGDTIDPTVYTELPGGGRVYFCCKDCIPLFNADPAKYEAKLQEQGIGIDVKAIKEAQKAKPAGNTEPAKPAEPKK